jgi:hypothetical protein
MHQYTVLDEASDGRVILKHDRGDYHLVRADEEAPPYGTKLDGDRPALGIHELVSTSTGATYQMRFERIDIDPLEAYEG